MNNPVKIMTNIADELPEANALCILKTACNDFIVGYLKKSTIRDYFIIKDSKDNWIPIEAVKKFSYLRDSSGNKTYYNDNVEK